MSVQVPATVETRVRKKWSKRAKLIGWSVIAGYVAFFVASVFLLKRTNIFIYLWVTGLGLGVRYLRTASLLEQSDAVAPDDATANLLQDYESKIRSDGLREVAGGTLSIPTPASEGELSLAREPGRLSVHSDGD